MKLPLDRSPGKAPHHLDQPPTPSAVLDVEARAGAGTATSADCTALLTLVRQLEDDLEVAAEEISDLEFSVLVELQGEVEDLQSEVEELREQLAVALREPPARAEAAP